MRPVLSPENPEQRLDAAAKARLGAEILGTYARVRWLLREHDLPTVVARLEAGPPLGQSAGAAASLRTGQRLARSVCRCLAGLPADSRCLVRSLVLIGMLARRGIAAALVIGVRPGSEFAAHAWVERDRKPLLPTGDAYARLVELGRQSDTGGA